MSLDCTHCKYYNNCQHYITDPEYCNYCNENNNWEKLILRKEHDPDDYIDKSTITDIINRLDRIQLYLENPLPEVNNKDSDWNFDLSQAEEFKEYPVLIVDNYGDGTPNVYVKVGFKTSDKWIVGYEHESGVIAFHELPKPLSIQEINKRLKE